MWLCSMELIHREACQYAGPMAILHWTPDLHCAYRGGGLVAILTHGPVEEGGWSLIVTMS